MKEIDAIVKQYSNKLVAEIAIIENLQREDLNPVEVAKGIKQLMEEYGLTQEKVSERLGKSRSAIANSLRILTLYPEVLELVEKGKVSFGHAKILASITDYAAQVILEKKILNVRVVHIVILAKNKNPLIEIYKKEIVFIAVSFLI